MSRSGKLIAINDIYIKKLISDPLYDIRPDGTIWTCRDKQGHIQDIWRESKNIDSGGYPVFKYGPKKNKKYLKVARVIYQKYVGELEPDLVINHIDNNKLNSSPENLELVTQSKNTKHSYDSGSRTASLHRRKLSEDQVRKIRKDYQDGKSLRTLAEEYQLAKSTISYIVNFKTYQKLLGTPHKESNES